MCKFVSWVEVLDDRDKITSIHYMNDDVYEKEKVRIKRIRGWQVDLMGHGMIRKIDRLNTVRASRRDQEVSDELGKLRMVMQIPLKLRRDILAGKFRKVWGIAGIDWGMKRMLNGEGRRAYEKKVGSIEGGLKDFNVLDAEAFWSVFKQPKYRSAPWQGRQTK